jgi:hypothetical protein
MTAKNEVSKAAKVKATAGRLAVDRLLESGRIVRDRPGTGTGGFRVVDDPEFN